MLDIEIETVWRFRKEGSPQTAVVMLGILNEIRKTGKLTSAAKHAQLSYRHVWNLVEQWSDFFGVHASHGFAVSKLRELLDREPGIGVDLRYVSNQNSLLSLAQGACDLSGVHLPRGELRAPSIRACKEWLAPREDRA